MTRAMTAPTVAPSTVSLLMLLAPFCISSASAAKVLVYPFGHCLNSHLLNAEKVPPAVSLLRWICSALPMIINTFLRFFENPKHVTLRFFQVAIFKQESCVIAKMTAQCILYMGALKIFVTPWLRPRLLFPTWDFVPIDPVNVPTKFEVRSFTRCWDNSGYPKNWAVPGYAHAPFSPTFLMGFYSD